MNKNILVGFLFLSSSLNAFAVDGHNGITFKMTQKQVEAKGFVCNPETERKDIIAVCNHMEMKGSAFGIPTENYEISIGSNKRVDEIRAEFVGFTVNVENYVALTLRLQKFFPTKDDKLSFSHEYFIKDFYRAKDKTGAAVYMSKPIPLVSKGSNVITFYSPHAMSVVDKSLADKAKQIENNSSTTTSEVQENSANTNNGN